jgi:hypothetical protein
MNIKQYEISTGSRYSWTNLHANNFVTCRKCMGPLRTAEYQHTIENDKVVVARLPDRCTDCEERKRLKKEERKEAAKEMKKELNLEQDNVVVL